MREAEIGPRQSLHFTADLPHLSPFHPTYLSSRSPLHPTHLIFTSAHYTSAEITSYTLSPYAVYTLV